MACPSAAAITAALADHGPATGPELAGLLDAHPATIERRCRELQRRGRVRQATGGIYTLVEGGRERVASD